MCWGEGKFPQNVFIWQTFAEYLLYALKMSGVLY